MSFDSDIRSIIDFWFGDTPEAPEEIERNHNRWFFPNPAMDAEIEGRFGQWVTLAGAGELAPWAETESGRLALILVLDQFPRQLFRGTSAAFRHDRSALELALDGIERGFHEELAPLERVFFCMPLQHAESRATQELAVKMYSGFCDPALPSHVLKALRSVSQYATVHRDIVSRFGRFPHRNAVLGRQSSNAELAYLSQGGQTFGQ